MDGGWWMVDGWVPKRFFDFAETLHTYNTPKVIFFILGKKCDNFLMGLKIDFKFEICKFWFKISMGSRPFFS